MKVMTMMMMTTTMMTIMMVVMTIQLGMMNIWLLMIDDASMDTKFDDFAKRDGRTDGATDRHSGLLGCDGRIQKVNNYTEQR